MTTDMAATPAPAAREPSWPSKRALTIAGAVVLVTVMVIGAFSIGVWVGSGRSDNPSLFGGPGPRAPQPGQQVQPRPGQAPPGPSGRPVAPNVEGLPRAPDLVGRITAFSGSNLTIDTPAGPRIVRLQPDTKVLLPDGSSGQVEDLRRGATVAVVASQGDDARSLQAEYVAVLPGNR